LENGQKTNFFVQEFWNHAFFCDLAQTVLIPTIVLSKRKTLIDLNPLWSKK